MQETPIVSICMITYGHEEYIKKAIEGVLIQECSFKIELILANDCSPDNTNKIILELKNKHPKASIIKYFVHDENLGMMSNFLFALKQCKGKFIALCDGDDYWTDSLKLQKQVDFLEENQDYNLCFHNVQIFNQESRKIQKDNITREVGSTTTINDLVKGNYIHTPSVIMRNNFSIPKWFKKSPIGDYPLYCLAVKNSKIFKINGMMSVYRVRNESVIRMYNKKEYYSSVNHQEKFINLYYQLWTELKNESFKKNAIYRYKSFRKGLILDNEFNKVKKLSFKMITKYSKLLSIKGIIIAFISMFFPSFVKKNI